MIHFDHVSFGYSRRKLVLEDLSMQLQVPATSTGCWVRMAPGNRAYSVQWPGCYFR